MSEGPTQPITGASPQPFMPPPGGSSLRGGLMGGGGLAQQHDQLHAGMGGQMGQIGTPPIQMQPQPAVMPQAEPYGMLGMGAAGAQAPLADQIPKVTGGVK